MVVSLEQEMVDALNKIFSGFSINANCIEAVRLKHFSFYDCILDPWCRLVDISKFSQEISLALKSLTPMLLTTIPERGIVRLQTVHTKPDILYFDQYYEQVSKNQKLEGDLPFVIGEKYSGEPLILDMSTNPHLLVAGTTGSGKSVLLHTLIANAAKREDVDLYLSDTKRVEFGKYESSQLPAVKMCAFDFKSTMCMLEEVYSIMEKRYKFLGKYDQQLNNAYFSRILIILDEVSDLILLSKTRDFEKMVVKLAQKARAAGIYMVLATQRPSSEILTGLIKANFSARIAFKVASRVDSRVILDEPGAETLAGKGDGIINNSVYSYLRFQSTFITPQEIISKF
jgi:DNA segregation ATPase FtsK/SpoIIIE, S-DNA-T family